MAGRHEQFRLWEAVIAIDGRSGAGKSTIADAFTEIADCSFLCLDDFYQTTVPKSALPSKSISAGLSLYSIGNAFVHRQYTRSVIVELRLGMPSTLVPVLILSAPTV